MSLQTEKLQAEQYRDSSKSGFGAALRAAFDFRSGKRTREDQLTAFYEDQAAEQGARADELFAELDAQGRPVMDAEVQRLNEVAALSGETMDLAQQYAREGMPEAQRQMAADDIARSQAQALGGASSLGAGLRTVGSAQANTAQAYRGLAAQDAMMAQQNQAQYLQQRGIHGNALSNLAGAEARQEGYNEIQPYEQKLAEAQALEAASLGMEHQSMYFPYQARVQDQQMYMDLAGSMLSAGGQAAVGFSDRRLKENISHTGTSEQGYPIYEWNYIGDKEHRYSGTMAQELIKLGREDAVTKSRDGMYMVDYSKIDVEFKKA